MESERKTWYFLSKKHCQMLLTKYNASIHSKIWSNILQRLGILPTRNQMEDWEGSKYKILR